MNWQLRTIFEVGDPAAGARAFVEQLDRALGEIIPGETFELTGSLARAVTHVRQAAASQGTATVKWLATAEAAFRGATVEERGPLLAWAWLGIAIAESMTGDGEAAYHSLQAVLNVAELTDADKGFTAQGEQKIRGVGGVLGGFMGPTMGALGGEAATRAARWLLHDEIEKAHVNRKLRLAEIKAAVRRYLSL